MTKQSKAESMRRVGENLWLRHGRYYARLKKSDKDIWKSLKTSDRNIADARLLSFKTKRRDPMQMAAQKATFSVT
ncbi:MAG: hypothetical protein IT578_07035 [Verrucomicrobiae bacterium]|nr:hypothetical protein [Verrucomicrobiae bacterium]